MTMPGRSCVALMLLILVQSLQFDFVNSRFPTLCEAAYLE
jgi:hypothetical protein